MLVVLLVSVVLAALVLLSTVQFSAILSGFVQGRLAVLVQSAQGSFRSATSLGLPLSSVRNGRAILERVRQVSPQIAAIHVFDPTGRIIFSTDTSPAASLQATAMKVHGASKGGPWRAETNDYLLSGMPIPDATRKRSIGGVVIVYPKAGLQTTVRAMAASLALYAVAVTLLVGALGVFILRVGLHRLITVFAGIQATFRAFERREWRHAAGGTSAMPAPVVGAGIDTRSLPDLFDTAERQYVFAGQELAALDEDAKDI
jgi:hypothetical protein